MKTSIKTLILGIGMATASISTVDAQNQGIIDNGSKYGADSVRCITNLSLYKEFYRQQNYKDALPYWRWVLKNCPRSRENTYLDGIRIMEYKIHNEKDAKRKDAYVDTLMMVFDNRIKFFPNHYKTHQPQEGNILGRKGVMLYEVKPEANEQIIEILKRSIELEGASTPGDVIVYYFRAIVNRVREGKADSSTIVDVYDQVSELIDANLNTASLDEKMRVNWENIRNNVELTFEPYATCKDLTAIYEAKFKATPDDIVLLQKITKILDKKKCTDTPLFFQATQNLHKLQPDAVSAYMMARLLLKDEKYAEAIPYLKDALELQTDDNKKSTSAYLLASVYLSLKNYTACRSYAQKAMELRPGDGNPILLIGDAYAASAKDCGDDELTKKAGYWAAVDKYIQAKRLDPSIAEAADKRIGNTSAAFPTQETIFFHGLKVGDTYKVECWINETTTIRAAR